jgi:F0F1-type ATP synthase epsilon subunit
MFPPLQLRVLTPADTLLDAVDVRWVRAELADGAGIGIWPGHAPLVAETLAAPLRYEDQRGEHSLALLAGILWVTSGRVTIYTTGAMDADDRPIAQPDKQ